MKRIGLLILAVTLFLVGCSEDEVAKSANQFAKDSKESQLTESEYVSDWLKNDLKQDKINVINEILEPLNMTEDDVDFNSINEYKELRKNINSLKDKTEYSIKNVKTNESNTKADVTVEIKYVDIGEGVVNVISQSLDRGILMNENLLEEEKFDERSFVKQTLSYINEEIEEHKDSKLKVEDHAKIEVIKSDDKWIVNQINERTKNALTLDFLSNKDKILENKIVQVEKNKEFLEIEAKLKNVLNELNGVLGENNNINYNNMLNKKKEISDLIAKSTDENVKISKKPGDKKSTIYISKGNKKNEVVISVIEGESKFELTEEVN